MIKVLVHGSNGKMGAHVREAVLKNENMELLCGVDKMSQGNEDYKYYSDFSMVDTKPDVIIDFSFHTVVKDALDYAVKVGCPIVVATTGLTDEEKSYVNEAAKKVAVFVSGNMSIGIATMCDTAKRIASAFPDAEIEIVETHHIRKADAPSGTALMLADSIKEVRPDAKYVYGRSGMSKREKNEIGIHALRMANIVGVHEVYITTDSEQIVLKHTAFDRALFADGAIKAGEFLACKSAGIYNMKDIFKN
jgi:4-hydroxy-tetrahydrodipicolinate reductase